MRAFNNRRVFNFHYENNDKHQDAKRDGEKSWMQLQQQQQTSVTGAIQKPQSEELSTQNRWRSSSRSGCNCQLLTNAAKLLFFYCVLKFAVVVFFFFVFWLFLLFSRFAESFICLLIYKKAFILCENFMKFECQCRPIWKQRTLQVNGIIKREERRNGKTAILSASWAAAIALQIEIYSVHPASYFMLLLRLQLNFNAESAGCVCLSHCQNVAAASITCIFKMTKLLLRLLILRFHDSLSLHLQRYSLLSYFGRSSKSVLNLSIYFCLVVDTVFQIVIYSAVRLKSFKIKPHWILVKADNSQ